MSSEKLASAKDQLKGDLGGSWNILEGSESNYTDLGIARRFGGSAAAYSLRDIGAMNGPVVNVRREPHDDDDPGVTDETDFSASQVQSGALEDWVNGKLESTLPADVATAAAAYSLRKVSSNSNVYTGDYSSGVNGIISPASNSAVTITGNIDGISDGSTSKDNVLKIENNSTVCPQLSLVRDNYQLTRSGKVTFTYYVPSGHPIIGKFWQIGSHDAGANAGSRGARIRTNIGVQIVGGTWTEVTLSYGSQYGGTDKFTDAFGSEFITITNEAEPNVLPFVEATANDGDIYYISAISVSATPLFPLRIRRSSDEVEVNVAFDSDNKISNSSLVENETEQGGESGSTTATTLGGFINSSGDFSDFRVDSEWSDNLASFSSVGKTSFSVEAKSLGSFNSTDTVRVSAPITNIIAEPQASITKFKTTFTIDSISGEGNGDATDGALYIKGANSASGNGSWNFHNSPDGAGGDETFKFTSAGTYTVEGYGEDETDAYNLAFKTFSFIIYSGTQVSVSNVSMEVLNDCTVHTWYDQAGSNNAVQETDADQPKIAESGALLDGIKFSSASDGTSATHLDIATKLMDSTDGFMSSVINSVQDMNQLGVIYGNRNNNSGFVFGIHQAEYPQVFYRQSSGANRLENTNFTLSSSRKYLLSVDKDGTNDANLFGNAVSKDTDSSMNYITSTGSASKIGQGGNTVTSDANGLNANINELIFYNSDQANDRFKIESNINNYYSLYNDEYEWDDAVNTEWQNNVTDGTTTFTANGKDGFTITATGENKSSFKYKFTSPPTASNDYYKVSFNVNDPDGLFTDAQLRLTATGAGATSQSITNGFNSMSLRTGASFEYMSINSDGGGSSKTATISDFKISRIARDGFVETWYDQSGNGRDMIQGTAGNQPSIVSNGGYMGGVYSAPASNSTTSSNKQYMRITGTNSFASNDLTTTKVGMVAIVNSLESGTASGVSLYTVLGNIRGVQSFPTGGIGLQISGTTSSEFTNYTATNAENKDSSSSTRTVGQNTLIGGTMDNRNIKTFTFTEQGSDTDTTTASTDIVLTSQKDFGIFYATYANDSGGEDLNVTRTAGGYMKEAYILDGDIIDNIDAINLKLRQHYNLA